VTIVAMLATAAAVAGLLAGAARHSGNVARGYRWLGGAALFWLAALIVDQALAGQLSSGGSPLSLADVAPLLALGCAATGIMVLAEGERRSDAGSVLPGLADGYVMAVALLVIGWVLGFGEEFHHLANEAPQTFLLDLLHPLADLAVLGALLPVLTAAWRRVLVPYIGLLALTVADSLGVGAKVASGGHQGIAEQLAMIACVCLIGLSPWVVTIARRLDLYWTGPDAPHGLDGGLSSLFGVRRSPVTAAGAATIIAAVAVVIAAFVVILNGLTSAPASGLALEIAGGAAVFVVGVRILMLVRENSHALRMWQEASNSLRDLADRTGEIVLICDLDGVIGYASPLATVFSYPRETLIGRTLNEFVHPEDAAAAQAAMAGVISAADDPALAEPASAGPSGSEGTAGSGGTGGNGDGRFSCRVRAAEGTWRHVECAVLLYRVPGEPPRLLISVRDVSDQVALRQQVAHLTFHDGLTGLPNRAYVEERAREVLEPDAGRLAGVIFLDIDGFTAVNDLVGHGAGDLVLAQAARRLRSVVPAQETVARWGGDEFAVLVENAASAQEVVELAERLAGVIGGEPFRVAERDIGLTASVGVALAEAEPGASPGVVLRNADVAMARAKDSGGGRVEVYAAHMHADVVRRLDMASDLQRAIAREELTLQYQPIVELATSRVTGAEALVRWWRGDEPVSPRAFLAVAEDSGLIVALGEWVLRKACAQGAAWRASSWDVGVSVNIALRQLNAPHFPATVAAALAETGLPPSALTIELSERMLVEDGGLINGRLAELRDLGVKLAIDDFGTGYASLAHLRQLTADMIKIDPSFVTGLGQDQVATMLTKTIVGVGRDLGMQVVAEGIEHPRQLAELREMGCGYGQGFLVARPMAAPGVEALIRTGAGEPGNRSGGSPASQLDPAPQDLKTPDLSPPGLTASDLKAPGGPGKPGVPDVNSSAKPGVPAA
jgi:diguanylate cyclase (GGDEF)-like protein